METRFCPKCHQVRQMRVIQTRKEAAEGGKKARRKVIRSFHCATCNTFVCSEDGEEQGGG